MKKLLLISFSLLFSAVLIMPSAAKAGCCRINWSCGFKTATDSFYVGSALGDRTKMYSLKTDSCANGLATLRASLASLESSVASSIAANGGKNRCTCVILSDKPYDMLTNPIGYYWEEADCNVSSNGLATPNDFDLTKCNSMADSSGSSSGTGISNSSSSGGDPSKTPRITYTTLPNPLGPTNMTIGSVPRIVGKVINAILMIIGSIALLVIIYGGFLWMTSAGNDTRVAAGKKTLMWAAVALGIIFLAWMLESFLFQALGVANY
jgi:hypothetical protein